MACGARNPLSPWLRCTREPHADDEHEAAVKQSDVGHDDARVVRWRDEISKPDLEVSTRSNEPTVIVDGPPDIESRLAG